MKYSHKVLFNGVLPPLRLAVIMLMRSLWPWNARYIAHTCGRLRSRQARSLTYVFGWWKCVCVESTYIFLTFFLPAAALKSPFSVSGGCFLVNIIFGLQNFMQISAANVERLSD